MDLTRHAVDVLPEGGLEQKLALNRPLRVKLGVDPTSPDVHLGFAYVLERLADFQRAGHKVVLIVGDDTDQRFNLLAGRDVMPQYGLEPQVVVTFPLLVGTDGELKMSKSRGNYIGITDPPEEMFGKVMSIPDGALTQWWAMLADGEHP